MSWMMQLLLALSLLVTSEVARAQIQIEANEMAVLPKYCEHAQTFPGRTREGVEFWTARIGPAFHHIHHYCWALARMHRARKLGLTDVVRNGHYHSAVSDIDYLLQRADADFVLLPEVLTRRGEALAKLKRHADAEKTFLQAIESKQDYWPAYRALAELYIEQARIDKARETLELGIERSSDPRALKRMLEQLRKG